MKLKLKKSFIRQNSSFFCFAIVAFFSLAAFALRLPSLTLNSFWLDELFTVNFVLASARNKIHIAIDDFHPPLFNALVYFWSLMWGKSEFALRMLSVIIGTITVPVSFLIFKKCFDNFTAFAIAIFVLFLPSHIYYSQELRSYVLGFLVAIIATATFLLYFKHNSRKNCYALAATCGLLFAIHYVSIFYIFVIYILSVSGIDSSFFAKWKRSLNLSILTFSLMLFNLPHFLYKRITMTSYWPSPVTPKKVVETILFLFSDDIFLSILFLILIFIAIYYAYLYRGKFLSLKVRALIFLSIFPLCGVILVSLLSPNKTILINRIILIFSPPIIVLGAIGISCLSNRTFKISIILLYVVITTFWLYNNSYYSIPTKSDFRGVAKEISKIERKNGKVVLISLDNTKMKRHKYYFDMYAVKSDIVIIDKYKTDESILTRIKNAATVNKTDKIVLFSAHILLHKHVIELCDKNYKKIFERIFTGYDPKHTFLIVYSISK